MIDLPTATRMATFFHALGEPSRLQLLSRLSAGGDCVKELARAVGGKVVNVSHHLSVLLDAGMVAVERRGRQRIYSLAPGRFHDSIPNAVGVFEAFGCRLLLRVPPPTPG